MKRIKAIVAMPRKEHKTLHEDNVLFVKTICRLNRMGADTTREQIIALAKEIEHYREQVNDMGNMIMLLSAANYHGFAKED